MGWITSTSTTPRTTRMAERALPWRRLAVLLLALATIAVAAPTTTMITTTTTTSSSSAKHRAHHHRQQQSQQQPQADQCDWTGSGGGGRGVRPVYLRCSRGSVSWRYPRGALRVVLSSNSNNNNNNYEDDYDGESSSSSSSNSHGFRGCIKASGPARVYLEGKGSLRLIYSPRDGKHEALHRCFRARGPIAALYVEADEVGPEGKHRVRLHYDLEVQQMADEEEAECRPCSREELAKAYCQSDLVARGTVSSVERRPELESAEILLRVTKTLRRIEESEENEIDSGDPRPTKEVRIRVPTVCDARHGQGEFVIMAKKRLGDLTLSCAPRLEEWAEAVREMESAPCVLRS